MNDGKQINAVQSQPLAEAAATQAVTLAAPHGPDHRRRRLIRGAVGIAPVVLTLRSGALAAASCVPAKTIGATTDGSGVITPQTGIVATDHCITPSSQVNCAGTSHINVSSETQSGPGADLGQVTTDQFGSFVCPNGANKTVAIISAAHVTSFAL